MSASEKKTLGKAIDELVAALEDLDDSARATAIRAACEHLGVSAPPIEQPTALSSAESTGVPHPVGASPISSPPHVMDIRTLKEQKQPTNAMEMVCLVAYYLESLASPPERKKEVSSTDMEKYFKQAGYRLPGRMAQTLVNARASGYLDSSGHGKYKLNPVGHNLVVHSLPKSKK